MIKLENEILVVVVDEESGADIVTLEYVSERRRFTHRAGLQTWFKSGTRADPSSGVLSNYYGGVPSPKFEIKKQNATSAILATTIDDLRMTKRIELVGSSLDMTVTVENISTDKSIPLQIENFCNLAGAKVAERKNTAILLLKNGKISETTRLEKFAQRYVKAFEHHDESIVVGNADWNALLEVSTSKNAESLALVIHANRLCWGINSPKSELKPGETFSFDISFTIRPENVLKAYPTLRQIETRDIRGKQRLTSSNKLFEPLFSGEAVFKERWSHLCLQYDKVELDDLKKIIAELLAPMRYTGVVFELDRGVRLKSHPEIAAEFALPVDAIGEIASFAKSHGLKVGIEFNTPGHQNETGIPEAHPELMEPKPKNIPGHVLCVSNPKTRVLIKEIIAELNEVCEPDMFFAGSDEVQFEGYKGTAFGHCEHSKGQEPSEIFGDYIAWLLDQTPKNAFSAICGDMFLRSEQFGPVVSGNGSEGDLWKAISHVPTDTAIMDWHYFPAPEYKSLDYFRNLGYDAWPVTAFSYDGTRNFLLYAEKIGVERAMHTTWSVPNPEKLFVETMLWAASFHWLGKKALEAPVREMSISFARTFW